MCSVFEQTCIVCFEYRAGTWKVPARHTVHSRDRDIYTFPKKLEGLVYALRPSKWVCMRPQAILFFLSGLPRIDAIQRCPICGVVTCKCADGTAGTTLKNDLFITHREMTMFNSAIPMWSRPRQAVGHDSCCVCVPIQ